MGYLEDLVRNNYQPPVGGYFNQPATQSYQSPVGNGQGALLPATQDLQFGSELGTRVGGDLGGYFGVPQQDIIPKDNRFDLGGAAKGFASVAGGIGGLAEAWYGMQGLKLAKEQLGTQNAQWEKNYAAQRDDIAVSRAEREGARARSKEKFVVA